MAMMTMKGLPSFIASLLWVAIAVTITITTTTHAVESVASDCDGPVPFTYVAPGELELVSPIRGQEGTWITITGEGLLGGGTNASQITLAGIVAEAIISSNSTFIQVVAGYSGSAIEEGEIIIIADTGAIFKAEGSWSYDDPASISSVSPEVGQYKTRVTISGTNMIPDDDVAELSSVELGGVNAHTIVSANATHVIVEAADAPAALSAADVVLTSTTGSRVTAKQAWQYRERGAIASVEPDSGVAGTSAIIYGKELWGHGGSTASITLAGVEATIAKETDSFAVVVAGDPSGGCTGLVG